jgi:predicted lipid carrier protein YhbT
MPTSQDPTRLPESVPETLAWLRVRFQPDALRDLRVTYQVELTGEGGGIFWLRVDGGQLSVGEGRTPRPDVLCQLAARDFFDVLAARANPELLYMEDRIRIEGPMSQALELRRLLLAA